MITFNFYKIQLLGNSLGVDRSHYTLGVIRYLEKTYPKVNFIKFYVGWGELVFLADRDLGEYDKTIIFESRPSKRPRIHSIAIHRIKKCYSYEIEIYIKKSPKSLYQNTYSIYPFGPNYKIFEKYYNKNILAEFADHLIYWGS
jgi:hypothetical protein